MMSRRGARSGVTLIELVTVVAILGIMAGVVGVTFRRTEPPPAPGSLQAAHLVLAEARRQAITTGSVVSVTVTLADSDRVTPIETPPTRPYSAVALPDGSILADPALAIERLTGRPSSQGGRR